MTNYESLGICVNHFCKWSFSSWSWTTKTRNHLHHKLLLNKSKEEFLWQRREKLLWSARLLLFLSYHTFVLFLFCFLINISFIFKNKNQSFFSSWKNHWRKLIVGKFLIVDRLVFSKSICKLLWYKQPLTAQHERDLQWCVWFALVIGFL